MRACFATPPSSPEARPGDALPGELRPASRAGFGSDVCPRQPAARSRSRSLASCFLLPGATRAGQLRGGQLRPITSAPPLLPAPASHGARTPKLGSSNLGSDCRQAEREPGEGLCRGWWPEPRAAQKGPGKDARLSESPSDARPSSPEGPLPLAFQERAARRAFASEGSRRLSAPRHRGRGREKSNWWWRGVPAGALGARLKDTGSASRLGPLAAGRGGRELTPRAFPLSAAPAVGRAGSREPMEGLGRSCLWLRRELSPPRPRLLLLDCRSRELYESARIGGALSVALPALLLRRLRRGSLSVRALLPGPPLQPPPPAPVLLYDQGGGRHRRGEAEAEEWEADSVLGTLLQKLREEGYLAYYLQGTCGRRAQGTCGLGRTLGPWRQAGPQLPRGLLIHLSLGKPRRILPRLEVRVPPPLSKPFTVESPSF